MEQSMSNTERRLLTRRTRAFSASASFLLWAACGAQSAPPSADPATIATSAPPAATGAAGTKASVAEPSASAHSITGTTMSAAAPPAAVSGMTAAANDGGSLPCAVDTVLKSSCQNCHGATPIGGAPMALMTYADLMKPANTQPAKKVYELVKERVHDSKRPMPPIGSLMPDQLVAIDTWVADGAKSISAAEASSCKSESATPPAEWEGARALDGSRGKLTPGPGETCYEFKVHGGQTKDDPSKFTVTDGEFYEQFYYSVPWPANTVATAYSTIGDNVQVLHHWLLFSTNELQPEGAHIVAPYPTLIGTDPVLLAGWAVGGPNLVAPEKVGFELPDPGRTINVQWHFYNSTGSPQSDASSVQICTVPAAMREHIGGVTWLGTEDLYGNKWFGGQGMPPHQKSTFTTTCDPGRAGLAADEPIHILGFEPHMHRIGKRMTTAVKKLDGTLTTIFDQPFSFGNETHYFANYDLLPGEQLVTTCSFDNDNDFGVMFGESSDTEMCYQFAFAYPAHALTNGAPSILGVPDTCWGSTTPMQVTSIY